MSAFDLTLFGSPVASGEPLASGKPYALLYYLCIEAKWVARETLVFLLWSDKPQAKAAANLRQALRRLKRLGLVDIETSGRALRCRVRTDVGAFIDALARADYPAALELYKAPLLQGVTVSEQPFVLWLEQWRANLHHEWRSAVLSHAAQLNAVDAPELLMRLLAADPLDEEALRVYLRSAIRAGRHKDALKQYRHFRTYLKAELGLDPEPDTLELVAQLSEGRRSPPLPMGLLRPPELVGRAEAWAQLEEAYQTGRVAFVMGAARSGKTRLILDFARSKGRYMMQNGRPGDDVLPYQSLARAVRRMFSLVPTTLAPRWVARELSMFMPGLFPSAARSTPSPSPRLIEAFWWAVNETLLRVNTVPSDDLQFSDEASLPVYMTTVQRAVETHTPAKARVQLSIRYGPMLDALMPTVQRLEREGVLTLIDLVPFNEEDTATLLEIAGFDTNRTSELHRLTGGNVQFLIEVLKASALGKGLKLSGTTLMEVVGERLKHLSPDVLSTLRGAAVLNQDAALGTLKALLGFNSAELARHLLELERAQLLIDLRFVHDLLYEATLAHTPRSVLRSLHLESAQVLSEWQVDTRVVQRHENLALYGR